jgi:transcription antitermination factor NusB
MRGAEVLDAVGRFLEQSGAEAEVRRFARELVDGCWAHRDELDARIAAVAENWEIRRMAVVDRNVLRLASYELLFVDDVPPKVSINEAIDLAKRYSTADSGGFVNGILDRIRMQAETEQRGSGIQ